MEKLRKLRDVTIHFLWSHWKGYDAGWKAAMVENTRNQRAVKSSWHAQGWMEGYEQAMNE